MIVVSGLEAKQYSITAEGLEELRAQLEALRYRRREVADEMREITSQSTDMAAREDSTLTINQNQATEIDGQISLLERIVGMAEVIEKPASSEYVQVGSQVTVSHDGQEKTYTIVGPIEADPLEGKVSNESPLGQSLLGKKVNDEVEVVSQTEQHTAMTILRIA